MGSCFSDCYDAYFASEYQAIPEDVAEERDRSCSSITTGTYHSEGNLWSDAGNTDFVLPSEFSKFYIMGELVGIGTTSKVYKVIPKRGGKAMTDCQPLACKIIDKRGLTNDIDYDDVDPLLEQLCREVEILRRIHHENIVTFYDYTETKDKLFIITERLDGGELFEYILNNGPLNEEFACRMLHGVFSAVAYLHERGVVHRDIKAENLIFCKDSSGQDSLKLIDFGFSTVLRHQMTGSFMGTGGYIAPEIRQNKSYSNSVDSWSLGVLVYCTLSARLPFGISIDALPSSIDQCRGIFDLTFPAKHWANVSPECKDLVTRLLEIDPNKRLTARGALNHAWFAPHAERAHRAESMQSLRSFDSDLADAPSHRAVELPVLHHPLRHTLSMSELERRGSETWMSPTAQKRPASADIFAEANWKDLLAQHGDSAAGPSDVPTDSSLRVQSEYQSYQSPHPQRPSSAKTRSGSDMSYTTNSSSSLDTTQGKSWLPQGARSGTGDSTSGSSSGGGAGGDGVKKTSQWEETHSRTAGELSYATFQHRSPSRPR